MDNFNNYSNNENREGQNNQNEQFTQNTQNDQNQQNSRYNSNNQNYWNGYNYNGNTNEFSYKPPKKPKHKKLLTGMIVALCVVALGATSLVGYSILSGNTLGGIKISDDSSYSQSSSDKNQTTATSTKRENLPTLVQLATPDDAMKIPDIVKKVSPSVVGISCMTNSGTVTGTGIIMSEDGYIITNAHVVDGANAISVVLPSNYSSSDDESSKETTNTDNTNDSIKAELIGKDDQTDIAVIKIDKKRLTAVEFGKSSEVQVGEVSIVIGNPLGLNLANSVTAGIISATDRTLTIEDRTMNLIQTDASINSGNSGGPLINAYGQVIGITSAKVASNYGEGLGFAIPIDEAIPIVKDLMENGYVTGRPTLGISGMNITDVYSQYYDVPKGFIVKVVQSGSAAEEAGIKENDIIVGIEGTLIESIEEFNSIKEKYKAGDEITVSLYRNNKIVDVKVVLGEAVETDDDTSSQSQQQSFEDFYNNYGNGYRTN